jgi:hypothetical protein
MKKDINLSSQVIDIKEDLVWTGSGGRTFLRSVGLERYSDVLRPI